MKHRQVLMCFFSLCLFVFGAIWVVSSPNNPHNFAEECETCHLITPQTAEDDPLIFNYDIDYLCNYCHEIPGQNSHPSQMVPSMAMPADFPLDWQGRVSCATCHDPHLEEWGLNRHLLRGGVTGRDFCTLCHHGLNQSGAEHRIADIVHARNALTPTQEEISGALDSVSLQCVDNCHVRSVGKVVDYRYPGDESLTYAGRYMNHPIGMNYREALQHTERLRPAESLSPMIALIEGKVGCASCHNQYSHEQAILTTSNRKSALCLQCHDM